MTTNITVLFRTISLLATFSLISACTGEVSNSEGAGPDTPDTLAQPLAPNAHEPASTPQPVTETTPPASPGPTSGIRTVITRVSSSFDDVEEISNGSIYADSSDLELINDVDDQQVVGLRFSVDIPQGALITSSYIQFTTDEETTDSTDLLITAERTADASPFTDTANNVSSRTTTNAAVSWSPSAWTSIGDNGDAQRTPDLSAIIQEVSNLPGWSPNNNIAFVVTGSGRRTAISYDRSATQAPTLYVEYRMASGETPVTPKPVTPTPEPVVPAPEPVTPAPEPVAPAPEPVAPAPEPVAPAPEPVTPAPEPVTPAPEPVTPAPEPVVNYTPVAQSDSVVVYVNESITIDVLANDLALNDGPIIVEILTSPSNGTAFVESFGDIRYRSAVGEAATDTLVYQVTDADGETSTATVSIAIECGTSCTPAPNATRTVQLSWNPNLESDIDGYYLYIGTQSGVYGEPIWVGNTTNYDYPANTGSLYFAVTAVNTQGTESAYSREVFVN